MIRLKGRVTKGFGLAGPNLYPVKTLIAERIGLEHVVTGTLNVRLAQSYFLKPDAALSAREYHNGSEVILLQRAVIFSLAVVVMRPHAHELAESIGHGATCLELMAPVNLRERFALPNDSEVEVELEGDRAWWDAARNAI